MGESPPNPDPNAIYGHAYASIPGDGLRRARRWPPPRLGAPQLLLGVLLGGLVITLLVRPEDAPRAPSEPALPPPLAAPPTLDPTRAATKVSLRVGEERRFAVSDVGGADRVHSWTLDGRPVGTGPHWTYVPTTSDVGHHRVEVSSGEARRHWMVKVRAFQAPRLLLVEPAEPVIETVAGNSVRLRVEAEGTGRVHTTWLVDGAMAGNGAEFVFRGKNPGATVIDARVQSDVGPGLKLEWRVNVVPGVAPAPAIEAESSARNREEAPRAAPPANRAERDARPSADAKRPQRKTERKSRPTVGSAVPATQPSPEEEVRRWLASYANAWRARDLEALRRMGQASTEREAAALHAYFEKVPDLEVDIEVLALEHDGDRTTVRFTRRDRFHDPTGRLVQKTSPTIQKEIIRTPEGLRFAPPGG